METYPDNFFIITSTPLGYGSLSDLELTPVYLRPFDDLDIETLVRRWASTWPRIGGTRRRPADRPDEETLSRARINNRALSPVDLSLKLWTVFADDAEYTGPEGWLLAYLTRHLPDKELLDDLLPQMAKVAALELDEGFITLGRLEFLVREGELDSVDVPEEEVEEEESKGRGNKKKEESSAQSRFLNLLRRSGLLVEFRGGRYQFRHRFIASYLASLTLANVDSSNMAESGALLAHLDDPVWSQAVAYAAIHTPFESAFRTRMSAAPDVMNNKVLEMASWLAYAPSDAEWRGPLLKYLGNMLVVPNQYPLLRERAAAAIVETRDKNALFIFRQAARNPNPEVRALASLGMGAVGGARCYPRPHPAAGRSIP